MAMSGMEMKCPGRVFGHLFGISLIIFGLCSCNGGGKNIDDLASEVGHLPDSRKVAYMMEHVSPDSVARFICEASLGHIEGIRIDTLANATLYAYENYRSESDIQTFSSEMDDYVSHLSLEDRMKIMTMLGEVDAQALGYQLGLEYVDHIRIDSMKPADVKREIEAFRLACASDTMMYHRFITGFKVALNIDKGKDLPEDIYNQFKSYE